MDHVSYNANSSRNSIEAEADLVIPLPDRKPRVDWPLHLPENIAPDFNRDENTNSNTRSYLTYGHRQVTFVPKYLLSLRGRQECSTLQNY